MAHHAFLRFEQMVSTLTASVLNRRAAGYLRKARFEFGEQTRGKHYSQKEFAALLAVKLAGLTAAQYRSYENRTRHVPAAVLLAAVELTGVQISLEAEAEQALIDRVVHRLREAGISAG
jgi:hypothetical protein